MGCCIVPRYRFFHFLQMENIGRSVFGIPLFIIISIYATEVIQEAS